MEYKILKDTAEEHYGVLLTDEQVKSFAKKEKDLAFYSDRRSRALSGTMDSPDRELLGQLIVADVLGSSRGWPVNGDGPEGWERFKQEFAQAAPAKGYKLVEDIWPVVEEETSPAPALKVVKAVVMTGRGPDRISLTIDASQTFTYEGYTDRPHVDTEATAGTGVAWVRRELGIEPEVIDTRPSFERKD